MNNVVLKTHEYVVELSGHIRYTVTAPTPATAVVIAWANEINRNRVDFPVVSVMQSGGKKELLHAARREMFALTKSQMKRIT